MTSTNWPLTVGDPDWAPLEAVVPPDQREDFMYMGHAGLIVLYKQRWTRRYLNIGTDGCTFFRYNGHGYAEISRTVALEEVGL